MRACSLGEAGRRDIPESEKICAHDGTALVVIGHEPAERYDYVAPQLRVLVHKRLKYAWPCCHKGVKIAPVPPQLLPKSMASASLLAHITIAKYVDSLPLTRESRQFDRLNVTIGPGTMALWMNTIGAVKLPPLIALMHEAVLAEPVLHCDEATVNGRSSSKRSSGCSRVLLWIRTPASYTTQSRLCAFRSDRSRNWPRAGQEVALHILHTRLNDALFGRIRWRTGLDPKAVAFGALRIGALYDRIVHAGAGDGALGVVDDQPIRYSAKPLEGPAMTAQPGRHGLIKHKLQVLMTREAQGHHEAPGAPLAGTRCIREDRTDAEITCAASAGANCKGTVASGSRSPRTG